MNQLSPVSATMAAQPIIELRGVTKEFHGVPALSDVNFTLMPGEIHALLGENGAGKSTLTKIIAGVHAPTHGEVLFKGAKLAFARPADALHNGIAMVFQETSLVPSLTVAQNIYLGNEKFLNRLRGIYIAAQQFLQSLNFNVDPTMYVSQLGAAQKQMVEIARAVHHKARIIIFDLPPLLQFDDVLAFSPYVDAALLVVEEGATTDTQLRRSHELLQEVNLCGVVLNKSREESSAYGSGYGYAYG